MRRRWRSVAALATLLGAFALYMLPASGSAPDNSRREIVANYLEGSTAEQRRHATDGDLTRGDYEAATTAALSCMRRAGLSISNVRTSDDEARTIVYTVQVPPGADGEQAMDRCDALHAQDVRAAWRAIIELEGEDR